MAFSKSKTKFMATALGALMLLSAAGSAFAHPGWGRGGLNPYERRTIRANERMENRYARHAWRDGHLSRNERHNLARMDRHNDRYIKHSRHDRW
jgi:hypothetical protein